MTAALTVEVQGTWLENFGAELMLRTVMARLVERVETFEVAIDPRWGDHRRRCLLEVKSLFPPRAPGWPVAASAVTLAVRIGGSRVRALLDGYGAVVPGDCRALFDVSGFAFGDQWGVEKARQRADRAAWYARRGCPVVAFPQAVGPFRDRDVAEHFSRFVDASSLVFLRDAESMAMARSVVREPERLRLAPDVTFDSPTGQSTLVGAGDVVIVPNARLMDKGTWNRSEYLGLLLAFIDWARERGSAAVIIVHSRERDDLGLAVDLSAASGASVVTPADALEAKARLAGASLVVASRFHALMAGLSQGVPVVSVGWSHKYEELLREFDLESASVGPGWDRAAVHRLADEVVGSPHVRERIALCSEEKRACVREIWDEVAGLLR